MILSNLSSLSQKQSNECPILAENEAAEILSKKTVIVRYPGALDLASTLCSNRRVAITPDEAEAAEKRLICRRRREMSC